MNKQLHIIYIPGLGDQSIKGQRMAINTWRLYGVKADVQQMNWADKEPWQPKFDRLLKRIDDLRGQNKYVALVGASAGAAAAINAYAIRKKDIVGVVCIAGKINRPEVIGKAYRLENPAFETAAYECPKALKSISKADRRRIRTYSSPLDGVVTRKDSTITGASNRLVPMVWHVLTIALMISLGAPFVVHFLKSLKTSH